MHCTARVVQVSWCFARCDYWCSGVTTKVLLSFVLLKFGVEYRLQGFVMVFLSFGLYFVMVLVLLLSFFFPFLFSFPICRFVSFEMMIIPRFEIEKYISHKII